MTIKDYSGNDMKVFATRTEYYNGNLAVRLWLENGEPWGTLTVNFEGKLPADYAYVDTNNMPDAEEFIKKNELGVFSGGYRTSGFCRYPLYKFNLEKIK